MAILESENNLWGDPNLLLASSHLVPPKVCAQGGILSLPRDSFMKIKGKLISNTISQDTIDQWRASIRHSHRWHGCSRARMKNQKESPKAFRCHFKSLESQVGISYGKDWSI